MNNAPAKSPKRKRRRYSSEVKRQAISAVLAGDGSANVVGQRLDVHPSTLANWVRDEEQRQIKGRLFSKGELRSRMLSIGWWYGLMFVSVGLATAIGGPEPILPLPPTDSAFGLGGRAGPGV